MGMGIIRYWNGSFFREEIDTLKIYWKTNDSGR